MNIKTYRNRRIIVTALIAALAAVSIAVSNAYILVAAVVAGMIVIIVLRRRVKEAMYDERTYTVAHKAARLTLAIIGIGMAVIGAILLAINRNDITSTPAQIGFTLLYATCALLIVNTLAYTYYNRKMGGKNE